MAKKEKKEAKKTSKDQKQREKSKKTRVRWYIIVAGLGIFLVVLYGIFFFGTYATGSDSVFRKMSHTLPYPAISVGSTEVISSKDLYADLQSIRQFYETQDFSLLGVRIDFDTPDGEKRLKIHEKILINKLIEDKVIESIVTDNKMTVTQAEVDQALRRKIQEENGGENVEKNIQRLYGWTLEEFKNRSIEPDLYKEKAQKIYKEQVDSDKNVQARAKIGKALQSLEAGTPFADVAQEYSEGETAAEGGLVGYVSLSQTDAAIGEKLLILTPGSRSNVIESELGYHIVFLHDTQKNAGETLYKVSQIFLRKVTFADWLNSYVKKQNIQSFFSEYTWDREAGMIEFQDQELRDFEENLFEGNTMLEEASSEQE